MKALIVMSVAYSNTAQETLRVQDTATVLVAEGWQVDVLAPRSSSILSLALPRNVRVYRMPRWPVLKLATFFRTVALIKHNHYDVIHGFDDGAIITRMADRVTTEHFGYIAEIHHAMHAASTIRHAIAIIVPSEATLLEFSEPPPKARVSILPDPHIELEPGAMTFREFRDALVRIYDYTVHKKDAAV